MKINQFRAAFLIPIVVGGISACESKHLVYVQDTTLGLSVGVSTETTQKFSLGYDRDVLAIVPKTADNGDAMSLLSVNKVEVESVSKLSVSEFVAGGEPATKLAKEPNAIQNLRNKIYGEE